MPLDAVQLPYVLSVNEIHAVQVGRPTGVKPPTAGEHEGALAQAVIVVHVLGTEVCSVYH